MSEVQQGSLFVPPEGVYKQIASGINMDRYEVEDFLSQLKADLNASGEYDQDDTVIMSWDRAMKVTELCDILWSHIKREKVRNKSVDDWVEDVTSWARRKGWRFDHRKETPEKIALMHSELSEALEEVRVKSVIWNYKIEGDGGKPEGVGVELADCVIRIMHWFGEAGLSLEECIETKMAYNEKRPFKHGKQF